MANKIPNMFTTYEMTDAEERSGFTLSTLTLQVLQNELALHAENKITLAFDPTNPLLFTQQEAYIRGKIDVLNWIISMSKQFTHEDNQVDNSTMITNNGFDPSPNQVIFGGG
jgi:hypothetical protein